MTYDCFTFFNELDLLEIRLNILNEVVDKFVLVEATRTHRGNPKPLYFAENKQRFAPFLDKIIHIVASSYEPVEKYIASRDSDPMLHPWAYENFQRHSIIRGLNDLKNEDTLIISDLDEIPTAKSVLAASASAKKGKSCFLETDHRSYYLNFRNFAMPIWGLGPIVLSGKTFRDPRTYQNAVRPLHTVRHLLPVPSPQLVRALKPDVTIRKSGWHFSFMGGLKISNTNSVNSRTLNIPPMTLQTNTGLPSFSTSVPTSSRETTAIMPILPKNASPVTSSTISQNIVTSSTKRTPPT